jgi:hypothetical protein
MSLLLYSVNMCMFTLIPFILKVTLLKNLKDLFSPVPDFDITQYTELLLHKCELH